MSARGDARKRQAERQSATTGQPEDELVEVFQQAWHAADERGEQGQRTLAGIRAVLAYQSVRTNG